MTSRQCEASSQESRVCLNHTQTSYCNYQPNGLQRACKPKNELFKFLLFKRLLCHYRGKNIVKDSFLKIKLFNKMDYTEKCGLFPLITQRFK